MAAVTFGLLKWIIFIYNAIFAILGFALLVTAAVVLGDTKDLLGKFGDFAEDHIKGPAGLMVFVGLVIFIVAGIGALSAVRENRCLVLTFATVLTVLVIFEFSGSIAAYAYRNEVRGFAEKRMMDIVENKYWNETSQLPSEKVAGEWDVIQTDLKCCGVHKPEDFKNNIPWSCCKPKIPDECKNPPIITSTTTTPTPTTTAKPATTTTTTTTTTVTPPGRAYPPACLCDANDPKLNKKGCLDEIADEFSSNLGTIGGFALALLFIQAFGILTSCYFSSELRKRYGSIA